MCHLLRRAFRRAVLEIPRTLAGSLAENGSLRRHAILLALLALAACESITVRPEGTKILSSKPNYEQSENYYFWGLKNEFRVDAKAACADKRIVQMQAQDTPKDVFYTAITLGIYSPRTARIWCE